jgi:hypothetical protein
MTAQLRRLLHAYVSRRSPWGPPWWIYGVSFAGLNLVRQALILMTAAEPLQALGVVTWFATALIVIIVVNGVAVALRPQREAAMRRASRPMAPLWPLRRGAVPDQETDGSDSSLDRPATTASPHDKLMSGRSGPGAVTGESSSGRPTTSDRWAPWWMYLVVIVGVNHLRRAGGVEGGSPAVRVVLALSIAAALFIAITVLYRAHVGRGHDTN